MALVSPGVQVTVIDESNYTPSATNSVPYILIATAQDKVSGTGVGVAPGTIAANANRPYLITGQRDLVATFGNPFFYKTTLGTPINGYELNEYGLLAAYSALGVSNRAFVQRVNINLTELTATLVRPVGSPADGTFWLNTGDTAWGIFEWNATTNAFTNKIPLVITTDTQLTSGIPSTSVGNIGDYAVVATNAANPTYYKNSDNDWVLVGSDDWKNSWPTIQGTNVVTSTLTAGLTIIINGVSVVVPVSPNNTLDGLVSAINSATIPGIVAENVGNRLTIYSDSSAESDGSTAGGGIADIDIASSSALLTALGVTATTYFAPELQQSYNYVVPRWRATDTEPHPTGSVWNKINAVNQGANLVLSKFDSTLNDFVRQTALIYANDQSANNALDPLGGGRNVIAGSTYAQYNVSPVLNTDTGEWNNTFTLQIFERGEVGPTTITGDETSPVFTSGDTFTIQTSTANSSTLTTPVTVTISGTTPSAFVAAVSAANVSNVSASVDSAGAIVFTQQQGGVIVVKNTSSGGRNPLTDAGFVTTVTGVRTAPEDQGLILSNWTALTYTASAVRPSVDPANGRYWYYSATNQVDVMISNGTDWKGYRNVSNDVRGYNLTQTDPNGPIISTTEPTEQSDGTDLVYGDLWVDVSTAALESYPVIRRWEQVDGVDEWVTIDNTDQTTENGILFADARWATNGTTDPVTGDFPSIRSLLTSDYLDLDAPEPNLYPAGMLLFNTRRSGYNVKSFASNYFNGQNFSIAAWVSTSAYSVNQKVLYDGVVYVAIANVSAGTAPTDQSFWAVLETNTWRNASGNRLDGSPYMGRAAQRALIVAALKSGIDSNIDVREEQRVFNLIACPAYPELIPNMVTLNNDRSNTAFIVGDTPMRLTANGTDIQTWATSGEVPGLNDTTGLNSADPYVGIFYPSCQTTDLSGSPVVQPPSHMMLRTIIRSDQVSYPWLAPAGTQRGVINNASQIGYINPLTGEFISIGLNQGLRDVLYTNKINPITFVPGTGITNFGNKTISGVPSALDRINVARLVAFLRGRLETIGKQYLFQPNDQITRDQIKNQISALLIDVQNKRGVYDFLVQCDDQNNTPARIDANELWVDIAIEPVKAVEFIYIPLRIKNTGEISSGQVASSLAI